MLLDTRATHSWLETRLKAWKQGTLFLVSPFITKKGLEQVVVTLARRKLKEGQKLIIMTKLDELAVLMDSLDLEAIASLLEEYQDSVEVFHVPNLHAKVYLFEDASAVVGSANLTGKGLRTNIEYGVELKRGFAVRHLQEELKQLKCESWEKTAEQLRTFSKSVDRFDSLKSQLQALHSHRLPAFPSEQGNYFDRVIFILRKIGNPKTTVNARRKLFEWQATNGVSTETTAPLRRRDFLVRMGMLKVEDGECQLTELGEELALTKSKEQDVVRQAFSDNLKKEYPVYDALCDLMAAVPSDSKQPSKSGDLQQELHEFDKSDVENAKRWAVFLGAIELAKGTQNRIEAVKGKVTLEKLPRKGKGASTK